MGQNLTDQQRLKQAWGQLGILGKSLAIMLLLLPILPFVKLPSFNDEKIVNTVPKKNANNSIVVTKVSPTPTHVVKVMVSPTPSAVTPTPEVIVKEIVVEPSPKGQTSPTSKPQINPTITPTEEPKDPGKKEEKKEENKPGVVGKVLANIGELKLVRVGN